MSHPLATFIKRFFSHYLPVTKGLSTHTIAAYRDGIKRLLCYASDTLHKSVDALGVEAITEAVVSDFLDDLEQTRHCCPSTRNARLAAIHSLFAFIARQEPLLIEQCGQVRAIPKKKSQHKVVDYLEENEVKAVLAGIDINTRTGVRDRALILILYNTGARVSEIVNLTEDDLQLGDAPPQVKLFGKGQKERCCPLWPETAEALKHYLQSRKPINGEIKKVFLNANGSPITRFGIRYVTRQLGAQTQGLNTAVKPLYPHVLRHTAAMHLLRAGNDINMISWHRSNRVTL
jgi:integrase/recombinase XerD